VEVAARGGSATFLGLAIGDWATYLASAVAVLVAIAAWIQAKRATKQSASVTIASLVQGMNTIFIEKPDLRVYFFLEGGTVPETSRPIADAIVPYVLNVYEGIWSLRNNMRRPTRKAWRRTIRADLAQGRVLAALYDEKRDVYPNLVKAIGRKAGRQRKRSATHRASDPGSLLGGDSLPGSADRASSGSDGAPVIPDGTVPADNAVGNSPVDR
jgi:hypothetical protein